MSSRRLRLLLYTQEFPTLSQTFLVLRVTGLLERGWDVHILCSRSDPGAYDAFPGLDGFRDRVRVASDNSEMVRAATGVGAAVMHFEFGHYARQLLDIVPEGCRVLVSFQGYDICIEGLDAEPGYYREVWDRAHAVHFPSNDLRDRARRRGLPADMPTTILPPLVDLTLFDPQDRDHLDMAGSSQRPLRLLSVGRLHWKKGLGYALRSVRLLAERDVSCHLRIVGDGPARAELEQATLALGLEGQVEFTGPLPPAAVKDNFTWTDVLVAPSTSEGFSCVALEAQAMRVPVVASDAEGLGENIDHGRTGYIVPRRDPLALAERLAELAASPATRQRLGEQGRARALQAFSVHAGLTGCEDMYNRLVSST